MSTRLMWLLALVGLICLLDRAVCGGSPPPLDRFGDPLPPGTSARMGTVRWRHGKTVCFVAFLPDAKSLLSRSYDGTTRFWDLATGKETRRLDDLGPNVYNVSLSPDGRTLASWNGEGVVRLWDLSTGKLRRQLEPREWTASVAFSPDGKLLASAALQINLWDPATGKLLRESVKFKHPLYHPVFTADGKTLISVGYEGKIRWWDVATLKLLREKQIHKESTPFLDLSPDGAKLATSSYNGTVCLWDAKRGDLVRELPMPWSDPRPPGGTRPCLALKFSPDGKYLATGSPDNSLRLWETAAGKEVCRLKGPSQWIASICFSADGKTVACGDDDGAIRLWDVGSRKELRSPPDPQGAVYALAVAPDDNHVAAAGADGTIHLWRADRGERLHALKGHEKRVDLMSFSSDGKTLTSASRHERSLRVWETATGQSRHVFSSDRPRALIIPAALAADGATVLTYGYREKSVRQLRKATGEMLHERPLDLGESEPSVSAFSPDGKTLFAIYQGGREEKRSLLVWDVASGREEWRYWKPTLDYIGKMVVAPDGEMLAVEVSQGITLWRWRGKTENKRRLVDEVGPGVISFAFSPDGRMLAWTATAPAIHLCELATRKERAVLRGHQGPVEALVFSRDGKRLFSGSRDATVLVWDLMASANPSCRELSEKAVEGLWNDLADADAARAYRAIRILAASPELALPLLRTRLQPRRRDEERIAKLIRDLDSDRFQTRDQATKELERLGTLAESALKQTVKHASSLELRRRIEGLLESLEASRDNPRGEELQSLRGLEVLEYLATAEARQLLGALARGAAESRRTREARSALRRLRALPTP